jgi:ABC-type nitrate/sulfonate/bicarbonate transport system substrate-binding protein
VKVSATPSRKGVVMRTSLLLFFVDDDFVEEDVQALTEFVRQLASSYEWSLGPPELVDQMEAIPASHAEDEPIRTLGGVLRLHFPETEGGTRLDRETDLADFRQTQFLVARLCELSKRRDLELCLELDERHVGTITRGRADELIRVGLLGEWERTLAE